MFYSKGTWLSRNLKKQTPVELFLASMSLKWRPVSQSH